ARGSSGGPRRCRPCPTPCPPATSATPRCRASSARPRRDREGRIVRYRVRHLTDYSYSEPVSLSHHLVHLSPRADNGQVCTHRELTITPAPAVRRERIDAFGNRTGYFSIEEPHRRLGVEALFDVTVPAPARPPLLFPASWESIRDRLGRERRTDALEA